MMAPQFILPYNGSTYLSAILDSLNHPQASETLRHGSNSGLTSSVFEVILSLFHLIRYPSPRLVVVTPDLKYSLVGETKKKKTHSGYFGKNPTA